MTGPSPKPTNLKLLQGNPGKRALNRNEPKPSVELLAAPDNLSDGAKTEWVRMSGILAHLGLLTAIDGTAFEAYCTVVARWRDAEEALKKTGPVVKSPSGYPMLSPYYCVANQSLAQMRAYLAEFGMTPSARSRISITSGEQSDPLEDFLFAKR
jgi:P27 family predicted phage terminase small subunit